MRYLQYYRNFCGSLVFRYTDEEHRYRETYIGYTVNEAIQRFREQHNLQRKHIQIENPDDRKTS